MEWLVSKPRCLKIAKVIIACKHPSPSCGAHKTRWADLVIFSYLLDRKKCLTRLAAPGDGLYHFHWHVIFIVWVPVFLPCCKWQPVCHAFCSRVLYGNKIGELPPGVFYGLTSLQLLWVIIFFLSFNSWPFSPFLLYSCSREHRQIFLISVSASKVDYP